MRIIDSHVHYGFWDKLFTPQAEEGFLEVLWEHCQEVGVEKVALLANPGRRGNEMLSRALEARPDFVIAMGRLELDNDPVSAVEDFYQRGFHGIKTIGVSKNYDHPDYMRYYEAAASRGLRILFHTGIQGGLMYTNQDKTFSISGGVHVERSSYPVYPTYQSTPARPGKQ